MYTLIVPTRDVAWALAYADGLLFIGTETGLQAIRLEPEFLVKRLSHKFSINNLH